VAASHVILIVISFLEAAAAMVTSYAVGDPSGLYAAFVSVDGKSNILVGGQPQRKNTIGSRRSVLVGRPTANRCCR
jgi:hypothetical protein